MVADGARGSIGVDGNGSKIRRWESMAGIVESMAAGACSVCRFADGSRWQCLSPPWLLAVSAELQVDGSACSVCAAGGQEVDGRAMALQEVDGTAAMASSVVPDRWHSRQQGVDGDGSKSISWSWCSSMAVQGVFALQQLDGEGRWRLMALQLRSMAYSQRRCRGGRRRSIECLGTAAEVGGEVDGAAEEDRGGRWRL